MFEERTNRRDLLRQSGVAGIGKNIERQGGAWSDSSRNYPGQEGAIESPNEAALKTREMISEIRHWSLGDGEVRITETAKAQNEIEEEIGNGGVEVEEKNTADTRKIGERNERDLRGKREGNVKPRAGDPCF